MTVKAEIIESPSDVNMNEVSITDKKGRLITIKKPSVLQRINFKKILGEDANNSAYFAEIWFYSWVDKIDGQPVTKRTQVEIEALVERLDEEGRDALLEGVYKLLPKEDNNDEVSEAKK
jgi:hypothetical protein